MQLQSLADAAWRCEGMRCRIHLGGADVVTCVVTGHPACGPPCAHSAGGTLALTLAGILYMAVTLLRYERCRQHARIHMPRWSHTRTHTRTHMPPAACSRRSVRLRSGSRRRSWQSTQLLLQDGYTSEMCGTQRVCHPFVRVTCTRHVRYKWGSARLQSTHTAC
jgi:hypothetical protein